AEFQSLLRGVRVAVEQAERDVGITARLVEARFARQIVDEPARGVAAEESPLRPFQQLDAIDVEEREGLRLGDGDVALVERDGIGRLDDVIEVVLRDAADRELRVLARKVPRDVYARRERRDVETLSDTERGELLTAERSDRNADILDVLFALLRRDHDLLQ